MKLVNIPLPSVSIDEITTATEFSKICNIENKSIFEIGGALDPKVAKQLGVRSWSAYDPRKENIDLEGYTVRKKSAAITELNPESCDFAFSCNAFEHISNLLEVLLEARRVLKNGGIIYSHFGPIWSAPDGHHLDITVGETNFNFWERQVIPKWSHLLFSEQELRDLLRLDWDAEIVEEMLAHVYRSPWLNRFFFEDYIQIFAQAGFDLILLHSCAEVDYPEHYPAGISKFELSELEIRERLNKIHQIPYRNFSCRDMLVILQKNR